MARNRIWYQRYDEFREAVAEKQALFRSRCAQLGASEAEVLKEVRREILIRAVRESNWQEGLRLSIGRTKELAAAAFDELAGVPGPHLDMDMLQEAHKRRVVALKREKRPVEELAAHNLSFAHFFLHAVARDLVVRQVSELAQEYMEKVEGDYIAEHEGDVGDTELLCDAIALGDAALDRFWAIDTPLPWGELLTEKVGTLGKLVERHMSLAPDELSPPMNVGYLHFLHRITMMGMLPPGKLGIFRRTAVHVGDPNVYFPPPSLVPGLVDEYCKSFPNLFHCVNGELDAIRSAAEASFRFVAIHPYADGNGRMSRLIMNLVLDAGRHPPVYLKADSKGRSKYRTALKRADRGSIEAMGSLIAKSLVEIYDRLLKVAGGSN